MAAISHAALDGREIGVLALKDAVSEARASLAASDKVPAGKAVAILPFGGKMSSEVVGLLKNALTDAGKMCVEGKTDPMWEEILKEIAWDERKEDILDPATLDRFGKLKSAQYLMYGEVRRFTGSERYILVELELHVSCIATKRHVWGGTFVRRDYAPGEDPKGEVQIPAEVRIALVDGIRGKIAESMAESPKLKAVARVAVLPIAGDNDQYAAGLFRDVLTKSAVTPVNLDVVTRGEARFALRESSGRADAIAYGALRDLGATLVQTQPDGSKTYRALMEMQLWIEKGATREILWSDTLRFSKEFSVGPRGWWDRLCNVVPFFRDRPAAIVYLPLIAVFGLILVFMFLRATTRVR
jgi:TolB-like protein